MNKEAILEAVKEVARLALFAALTAAVAWATERLSGLDPSSTFYIIGTVVLRFVDKFLHSNEDISATGISPF